MAEIIEMPKLSDTMTTGTLVKWLKNEGDTVAAGDMIAEVETDKATMEVECFEDGILLKQYIAEGDSVEIGSPICAVGEEGEEVPEVTVNQGPPPAEADQVVDEAEAPPTEPSEESKKPAEEESGKPNGVAAQTAVEPEEAETPAPPASGGERVKASPLARKVAEDHGLDLTQVKGTGPGGRITREDVELAIEEQKSAPAQSATPASEKSAAPGDAAPALAMPVAKLEETTMPVTNMRAAIARALVRSTTEAPHFYLQSEVDSEALIKMRAELNDQLAELPPEQGGIKFTLNDLILRAAAVAVLRVPQINRSWEGDKIRQYGSVHMAFGVAVDDGLVTPVIREAERKGLRAIAMEAKDLIGKARSRKLKPEDYTGSTLTVTNLGMFGITDFYGIINPPNAAILSIGTTIKTPVVADDGSITVGYRMKVGLSGDHRVIDGVVGAQYLAALKAILEAPSVMLV